MAQRDCAAVHVETLAGQRQLALDGTRLGGEGLVHFDQIHIVYRQSRLGQRSLRGWDWSDSHHGRIHTGNRP